MKIAVSASGTTLAARVDPRFGRCAQYLLVDIDNDSFEVWPNAAAMAGGGAGIQAAQAVVGSGAQAVISGNLGPNAFQVLEAAGIPAYTVTNMTIAQAVAAFKAGELTSVGGATNAAHSGAMNAPTTAPSPVPAPADEVAALKEEVAGLRQSVAALLEKIDAVSK
ncbi:MAG: NifB/NifX family molybdenum-iron cluster-binding protein [Chloroflexota bacterium]|nr:NifB/NifX family molybdenum-iron cluster-binding protein [Chloroflexota bacterium]